MISTHEIEGFVDELESEAEEIEDLLQRFLSEVSVHKVSYPSGHHCWTDSGDSVSAKRDAKIRHEQWQAKAEELVDEYRPGRFEEFQSHYRTIQDTLKLGGDETIQRDRPAVVNETHNALNSQIGIVRGVLGKVEAQEFRARRQISTSVAKDEIEQAWELFDNEFIRAAGVVAGVAIERKLLTLCEESDSLTDYNPNHGISRLSQSLYDADILTKTKWNDLKASASIRETCAHAEEPEKHKVRRLISDAGEFVRTSE